MVDVLIRQDDLLDVECDVLLLKYARKRFGADKLVADLLVHHGLGRDAELCPGPGEHVLVNTRGHIGAAWVLILGTDRLAKFGYPEMSRFAADALAVLSRKQVDVRHLATTIHGANYGLDACESLQSLLEGFTAGIESGRGPSLERISVVEKDAARAELLGSAIPAVAGGAGMLGATASSVIGVGGVGAGLMARALGAVTGRALHEKEHVFVAMPFADEFEDVYNFGIYEPIRKAGYICEHVGEAAFTGDVLERIRTGIDSAKLVIADLTEARPNVYLEAGFAWGRGVPVIFLARKGETVHFDVSSHRCIYYRNATHLAQELGKLVRTL